MLAPQTRACQIFADVPRISQGNVGGDEEEQHIHDSKFRVEGYK